VQTPPAQHCSPIWPQGPEPLLPLELLVRLLPLELLEPMLPLELLEPLLPLELPEPLAPLELLELLLPLELLDPAGQSFSRQTQEPSAQK
jgi:hypothetical protein